VNSLSRDIAATWSPGLIPLKARVCSGFRSASVWCQSPGARSRRLPRQVPPIHRQGTPRSKGDNPKSKSGGREGDSDDLHRGSLKTSLLVRWVKLD